MAAVERAHERLQLAEVAGLHIVVERDAIEDRLERWIPMVAGEQRPAETGERIFLGARVVGPTGDEARRQLDLRQRGPALQDEQPRLPVELRYLPGAPPRGRIDH